MRLVYTQNVLVQVRSLVQTKALQAGWLAQSDCTSAILATLSEHHSRWMCVVYMHDVPVQVHSLVQTKALQAGWLA